jgi:flagellar L-ring protein precursor FlgH
LDQNIARLGLVDNPHHLIGSGGNVYKGLGATTRTSNVTAKIAAVVVKVLANGNLMISGEHRVEVNDEVQTLKISGMVRPKDVGLQNTVYSYQVAGADVSVKGQGTVGDAESPGVFSRFFNWIF